MFCLENVEVQNKTSFYSQVDGVVEKEFKKDFYG